MSSVTDEGAYNSIEIQVVQKNNFALLIHNISITKRKLTSRQETPLQKTHTENLVPFFVSRQPPGRPGPQCSNISSRPATKNVRKEVTLLAH